MAMTIPLRLLASTSAVGQSTNFVGCVVMRHLQKEQ